MRFSIPWKAALESLPARLGALLVVLAAAAGFFWLRRGTIFGNPNAVAYAETIHHSVAPTAGGRVKELRVRVGQYVRAGEPIVVMDDRALQLARARAVAELAKASAEIAAAYQDEESKVTRSELWVLKAKAAERGDRASLEEVTAQVGRLAPLLDRQMIPATEAERAKERRATLAARVDAYDQAMGRGQAGLDKLVAAGHKGAIEARLEPYHAAALVEQATIRQLDLAIEELTLLAPSDGIVSVLTHRPGDVVSAGTEIVSIVGHRPGVVVAILPEGIAATAKTGGRARVRRGPGLGHAMEGTIIELGPEIEEMPARARPSPNIPAWGRRATIELTGGIEIVPGEAFHVSLR